jgi:hypothetical protein
MGIREEHNEMRGLFTGLNAAVEQIQSNLLDFVKDTNRTKVEVLELARQSRFGLRDVLKKVLKCSSDIREVTDATMSGMNLIANTFLQVFAFLAKVTTRPIPVFGSFDDALLELQRLSDTVSSQNEQYDDEQRQQEITPQRDLALDPYFTLPIVEIHTHTFEPQRRRDARDEPSRVVTVKQRTPSESQTLDGESRQLLHDFEVQLTNSMQHFTEVQGDYEAKLAAKADFLLVERIIEKMRRTMTKLRDKQKEIENKLFFCIQRSEAESLVQHVLLTTNAAGETAAGSTHVECLMCGRARSAVTPPVLPSLTAPSSAHSLLYGRSSAGPSGHSTRPTTRSSPKTPIALRPSSQASLG